MLLQFFVVIFLILLIIDRWKPRKFVKLHQQLGNDWTYWPVIGNATRFIGNNEDKMTTMIRLSFQTFKRKQKAISFWLGNSFFVGISDADQATSILKATNNKHFIHKFVKHVIGNGAIFAPVDIWRRRRKISIPTFAPRHVNKFVTIFEAQSEVTADLLESRVGKGNFSCVEYFNRCSLDSVCETLFGVNLDVQRQPDFPFFKALAGCLNHVAARMCQPWLHIDGIYKLLPAYARHMHMVKEVCEFVDNLIHKKKSLMNKRNGDKEETNNPVKKSMPDLKTFLELMINNSADDDKAYSDEELREEAIVLVIAGTDTSAIGTSFMILLLAQHADIQDKVYREIREVLGDSDMPLKSEDLLKLKYTRAVIKESLRLYPPVPFIIRRCESDLELPSGIILPKGCDVLISIWGIHHNPQHWGEDVNDFNPDRFMSGNIPSNAFMAFSYGSRNCIGQQYAMLFLTTILVKTLRRYRFTPATNLNGKNKSMRLSFDITLKNVNNYLVQVEYRDKCNE